MIPRLKRSHTLAGALGRVRSMLVAVAAMSCLLSPPAAQAQTVSRLEQIVANRKVRVCIWPEYYGITFRSPKTQQLTGIDAELALELGKDLGVAVEFVDSSFARLVGDVTGDRCDVAMFAIGITPQRSEKLRFTQPTLASDIYAITTRTTGAIRSWTTSTGRAPWSR
jgi:ABC-type amino acid transport substrate-binding protein